MAANAIKTDNHFLCASNAAATADQRDMDALALKVYDMPAVVKARQQAAGRFKMYMNKFAAEADWARFDQFMEEWCFNLVMRAVASDANYPKVMGQLFSAPHEWMGNKVLGSRAAGADNPDNNYVIMPVDGYAHFELHGQQLDTVAADYPMVVAGDVSLVTILSLIETHDLKINADGTVVVTISPEPADPTLGRANHLQTTLDARFVFIRECRSDWRQKSMALRLKRLDPPTAPPMTPEQYAARAALYIITEIPAGQFFMNTLQNLPPNFITPPFGTAAIGGLSTQMMALGRAKFADDEAYVITTTSGGGKYGGLTMGDPIWFISLDCQTRSGSVNDATSRSNSDGSKTLVICKNDPGIANWLDPSGFNEITMLHRWQALPPASSGAALPTIKGELVKLKDLDSVLPKETKIVTPVERKAMLADRQESYKTRHAY